MATTYKAAGVDIDAANRALGLIREHVRSTFHAGVLGELGHFGGLFQLEGYREPVLVSSLDGVGTKLKIAFALEKHDSIGIDLVHHCVNDILCCGAEPLFFLDYLAMGKLIPETVEAIVRGLAQACREVGCALIGGETAEMPGFYAPGEYDLAGFILGVVERERIIDGSTIQKGDLALGLPSNGLHTNGYSLVRKVFSLDEGPETKGRLQEFYPTLGCTLAEELLRPHHCYLKPLRPLLPKIKGLAHITGGGLLENPPRILPKGLALKLVPKAWPLPPIFALIQEHGEIEEREMYRTFNMGLGMLLVCSPGDAETVLASLGEGWMVGQVVALEGEERVVIA